MRSARRPAWGFRPAEGPENAERANRPQQNSLRRAPHFPRRLELLQEESGLPWAEIARRLGTYPYTVWRWYKGRARPHFRHQMALLDLADELGLAHLLTAWTLPDETRRKKPSKGVPTGCESPGRKAARRGDRHRRG